MLECEGYKMFKGSAIIAPKRGEPFIERGVWLYKPEYKCWYVNGHSYMAGIVENIEEDDR